MSNSKNNAKLTGMLMLIIGGMLFSCPGYAEESSVWTATQIVVLDNLAVPESVLVDPANGVVYVSNIEAPAGKYWDNDDKGYISRLSPELEMKEERGYVYSGRLSVFY